MLDFRVEYQIDVSDFFSGKYELWEFWVYFADLPSGSRTRSAISMDKEIASQQAAGITEKEIERILEERTNPGSVSRNIEPRGYSLEIEKLNQLIDAVNLLRFVVKGSLGGKVNNSDFKPVDRPKTAFEVELDKRILAYEKKYQEEAMSDFGF